MAVNGLEAFADAIMAFEGWKPGTRSYRNRNPGNLERGDVVDKDGYNVYTSLIGGYTALLEDLNGKFTGHNSHGLEPTSTILDLMEVYAPGADHNDPHGYATFICNWVGHTLGKPISLTTQLSEIYSE